MRNRRSRAALRRELSRRTCAGCGRVVDQRELVRFVSVDGMLTPGRTVPGRGAYTCRARACFDRAVDRRSFARILKAPAATSGLDIAALYTEENDG